MTLLAALVLAQTPATAADFFPLVPGSRRVYELKDDAKTTLIDEVGAKPGLFESGAAVPVLQKDQFNQLVSTTFYRIDGPTVWTVGYAEDRRAATATVGDTVDLTKAVEKSRFLMQLRPAIPVFKYEGKETTWVFAEIPVLEDRDPDPLNPGMTKAGSIQKLDPTSIRGTAKPGRERTVLGRKVETIEVRQEVQLGSGNLAERIVETTVYGRGIGLIESVRKTSGGGKKGRETKTTLIAIEEAKKAGG